MDTVKISKFQLIVLIIGFFSGIIINPSAAAKQDSWIAIIITYIIAIFIVCFYVYISLLNPGKTLIEILKDHFGKYPGALIGLLYVWYFVHLAAIVIRNYGDFVNITIFPETPVTFIVISLSFLTAYAIRKGLEVMARGAEIFVPFIPMEIILSTILLFSSVDLMNWKPFLENGIKPILTTVQTMIGFPVGEMVIFLMIFPALNDKKELLRSTILAVSFSGLLFLTITLRDLFVLGADMFYRATFPSALSVRLIPNVNPELFYLVSLLIGGTVKVTICIYAAVKALAQIFNIEDYKAFVYPMVAFMIALSIWLYPSLFELIQWSIDNYFYYAFPFEYLIPLILLILSIVKRSKLFS